ncbi:MAG: DNA translocase FtsK [Coriobacteriales bacterium]|nr:DNA translocase FtsK [Coriobacteriales bacterium]
MLQDVLNDFKRSAEVVGWIEGPTFTTYKVEPAKGVAVSRFTSMEDDIARVLARPSVRIYAPVPNTPYVGIEVPNKSMQTVLFGDVLPYVTGGPLDFAIGLDGNGKPVHADLSKLPHILIAGTTGSGKSVTVNTIVVSMLMRDTPDDVRFIMVDPKQVEFSIYNGIPHLIMPVVTDMKQAAAALQWSVTEMDRRYRLFSTVGVRNLNSYNEMVDSGKYDQETPLVHMPSIVIVIDELADLMMVAKKDVEASIVRIAQLGRACGIHLVMATQRPSADVVTGLIRANVANRIGLKVAKGDDSRIIIDQRGAEKLLGNGDMLFLQTSFGDKPRRIQGCWLSDGEVAAVVGQLKTQTWEQYSYTLPQAAPTQMVMDLGSPQDSIQTGAATGSNSEDEPLAWQAARLIVENNMGSTSMIQRRLKVGYARAGRLMDMLEEMGIVGPACGSKPREVLIHDLDELETLKQSMCSAEEDYS